MDRSIRLALLSGVIAVFLYLGVGFVQFFIPAELIFLGLLLVVFFALCSIGGFIVAFLRGVSSSRFLLFSLVFLSTVSVGAYVATRQVQYFGARGFMWIHQEELSQLAHQIISDVQSNKLSGTWKISPRSSATRDEVRISQSIQQYGFVLAELSWDSVAFAHYGFQGTYTGFFYSKNEQAIPDTGDLLFGNHLTLVKSLKHNWYLVTTR